MDFIKKIIARVAPWGTSPLMILLLAGTAFAAERFISLAPSTTEILFALGLDEQIVGVSSYCNYPAAAAGKRKMGDFSNPNIEEIVSLQPDYIFCTGLEQTPVITELKRLKFNVYVADPASMDELFQTITDMGKITNKAAQAQAMIDDMKKDVHDVQLKAQSIPSEKKVKVFIEIWQEPLMTAGQGSFVDELITLAGGINVAHDVVRPYCNYSPEKVVDQNPSVIIMTYMDKEPPAKIVEGRYGWNSIDAVKNKRIYNDINPDLLLRPGPRITEGLKAVFKKMYPQE